MTARVRRLITQPLLRQSEGCGWILWPWSDMPCSLAEGRSPFQKVRTSAPHVAEVHYFWAVQGWGSAQAGQATSLYDGRARRIRYALVPRCILLVRFCTDCYLCACARHRTLAIAVVKASGPTVGQGAAQQWGTQSRMRLTALFANR
jgi:hypothetical protein